MNNLSIRKMNELSKSKKKGFTLVELIIVIAIIAILAAIALPKFGQVRTSANENADVATAKIIATTVANGIASGEIILPAADEDYAIGAVGETGGILDVTDRIDGNTVPKAETTDTFQVTLSDDGDVTVSYTTAGTQLFPEP